MPWLSKTVQRSRIPRGWTGSYPLCAAPLFDGPTTVPRPYVENRHFVSPEARVRSFILLAPLGIHIPEAVTLNHLLGQKWGRAVEQHARVLCTVTTKELMRIPANNGSLKRVLIWINIGVQMRGVQARIQGNTNSEVRHFAKRPLDTGPAEFTNFGEYSKIVEAVYQGEDSAAYRMERAEMGEEAKEEGCVCLDHSLANSTCQEQCWILLGALGAARIPTVTCMFGQPFRSSPVRTPRYGSTGLSGSLLCHRPMILISPTVMLKVFVDGYGGCSDERASYLYLTASTCANLSFLGSFSGVASLVNPSSSSLGLENPLKQTWGCSFNDSRVSIHRYSGRWLKAGITEGLETTTAPIWVRQRKRERGAR
ncbi:hypothetical protein EV421DRAFT_1741284 [Armillaria borealis]|uniref:Uncharacterized protein n=1 Tax=Armillaria borealis TaxID=47425 RepID=A0AA39J301_9AGAR|nr:hypothetical protein EV421DRAFT_1741284 [Armillaria borealis]